MFSKQSTRDRWLQWNPGTDFTVALTLYQKLMTPIGATNDPYGPGIYFGRCRKREFRKSEVQKYGPMITVGRSHIFELPVNATPGSVAAQIVVGGTPPRGSDLTVISRNGPPVSSDGSDGNWFFDSSNIRLYGPKASGAWPSSMPLWAMEESVLQEADGTLWTVNGIEFYLFDNFQIIMATPEI